MKYLLLSLYLLCFVAGITVISLSIGMYFSIFIVVLIPALILHGYAGRHAFRKFPQFNLFITISSLAFLGFSLFRLDIDTHGTFTGYTSIMARVGTTLSEHDRGWSYSLELSMALLLAMIFIDTYIVRSRIKVGV